MSRHGQPWTAHCSLSTTLKRVFLTKIRAIALRRFARLLRPAVFDAGVGEGEEGFVVFLLGEVARQFGQRAG